MSWKAIAAGCGAVCGALFIGYCVYFDKKRRNDPDYRKKVMERRKKARSIASEEADGGRVPIDLSDPNTRKEFLMDQMKLANQKMMENNLPEAISHLINFVSLSGNPQEALTALQQSLPPAIFQLLVQTMARLGEEHGGDDGASLAANEPD